jgi:hypothetical protein
MIRTPASSPSQTYRRGQAERALWQVSLAGRPGADKISPTFRTRVKRLLEIDRAGRFKKAAGVLAFSQEKPEGTGIDAEFTAYDVFILALGLDLLRMGFVQSEVVLLMGFLRGNLAGVFAKIIKNAPDPQRRIGTGRGKSADEQQDRLVFLVLERVDLSEEFPAFHHTGRRGDSPIYKPPKVCHGADALKDELARMNQAFRRALILELSYTAAGVSHFLESAPAVRRGRPGSQS